MAPSNWLRGILLRRSTHTHTHTHTNTHTQHTHAHTHTHTHTHRRARHCCLMAPIRLLRGILVQACGPVAIYLICIYMFLCVCVCVCVYNTCIYIYTHIGIWRRRRRVAVYLIGGRKTACCRNSSRRANKILLKAGCTTVSSELSLVRVHSLVCVHGLNSLLTSLYDG
jgi:hypothetical protein